MIVNQVSDFQLRYIINELIKEYHLKQQVALTKEELATFFNKSFIEIGRFRKVTEQDAEKVLKSLDIDNKNKTIKVKLFQSWRKILNEPDYKQEQKQRRDRAQITVIKNSQKIQTKMRDCQNKPQKKTNESSQIKGIFTQMKQKSSFLRPDENENINQISEFQLRHIIDELVKSHDLTQEFSLNKTQLTEFVNQNLYKIGRFRKITEEDAEKILKSIHVDNNGEPLKIRLLFAFKKVLSNNSQQEQRKDRTQITVIQNSHKIFGNWQNYPQQKTESTPIKTLFPQMKSKSSFLQPGLQFLATSMIDNLKFSDKKRFSNDQFQTPIKKKQFNSPIKNPEIFDQTQVSFSPKDHYFRNYSPQPPQYQQQYPEYYPGSPKYTDINRVSSAFGGDKRQRGSYFPDQQRQFSNYPTYYVHERNQRRLKWNKYKYGTDKVFCDMGQWGSC